MRLWILDRVKELATGLAQRLAGRGIQAHAWADETAGAHGDSLAWPAPEMDRQVRPGNRPGAKVDYSNKLSGQKPSRPGASASGKIGAARVRPN